MSDALRALVRDHSLPLYRYALWMCGDRIAARELVREAFVATATSGEPPPRALLLHTVRREHARRFGVRALDLSRVSVAVFERDGGGDPPTRRAIAGLPAEHREPLVLRDVCGFDEAEIAEALRLSPEAVPERLARARSQVIRAVYAPRRPYPRPQRRRVSGLLGAALALSLAGAPVLLVPDLEDILITHAASERDLRARTPLPREVVEGALYGVGARLRAPLGAVLLAERCKVAGGAVHLVLRESEGIVDLLVLPHTHIGERSETRRGPQTAILLPMGTGTVAILGSSGVHAAEATARQSLWFVTD